jgi:hypothetical protein
VPAFQGASGRVRRRGGEEEERRRRRRGGGVLKSTRT